MINALSVDVEDYYHVSAFEKAIRYEDWGLHEYRVERNTYRVLDLLEEYNLKATFFILAWVAERSPTIIRAITKGGHEVASHGYAHQLIYKQTPKQFREETRLSKKILEDISGSAVIGYRAASYSITASSLWAVDILAEEGFQYDSSIFPVHHDRYGIPGHERFFHILSGERRGAIAEIPLSTVRIAGANFPIAGGGYFRMLPYAITHGALRYLNEKEKQPAIFYFHPWEIDPDQPRIRASWLSRVRHYSNLASMEKKLRRLLSNFSFAPIREVYASSLELHAASVQTHAA